MLFKDKSQIVRHFYENIKIKDGDGDVHDIFFNEKKSGVIVPCWDEKTNLNGEGKAEFRDILKKEGVLSAFAEVNGNLFSSPSKCTIKFKFHLEGFKNAMRFLQSKKGDANQLDESDYDDRGLDIDDSESGDSEPMTEEEFEAVKEKINFSDETESVKEETNSANSNN